MIDLFDAVMLVYAVFAGSVILTVMVKNKQMRDNVKECRCIYSKGKLYKVISAEAYDECYDEIRRIDDEDN